MDYTERIIYHIRYAMAFRCAGTNTEVTYVGAWEK